MATAKKFPICFWSLLAIGLAISQSVVSAEVGASRHGLKKQAASVLDLGAPASSGLWTVTNANGSIAVPATVPGGIFTDLLAAGLIDEPYYAFNDRETKWVTREDWTWKRSFEVDQDFLTAREVTLVFDGLDTVSTVLLNGIVIGYSDNSFVRYLFHVKSALQVGQNELEIRFQSPVNWAMEQASAHLGMYGYPIVPDCQPPDTHPECNQNMIRKMQASYSWDWGPAFPSVGIWKSARLEAFTGPVIRDVKFSTTPEDPGSLETTLWLITLEVYMEASSLAQQNGILEWAIYDLDVYGNIYVSNEAPEDNFEFVVRDTITISAELAGIRPWWPNGYGEQTLYSLAISFRDAETEGISSERVLNVGFRDVQLIQEPIPGAEEGLSFYFLVNNVRIFAKGSNWIPADVIPERVTREYLRDLLESVKLSHQNMMRVWGGGIYESDDFYELADELGIMIWQDLMFACAMYPVTTEFLDSVRREVRTQVRRLHHHPSVVLWAGNNENEAALRDNWYGTGADFRRYYDDYVTLYVDVLRGAVPVEDPSRPFVLSSPSNGPKTDEEGFVADWPGDPKYGDVHVYDYTSDGWDWRTFPRARFASEYGYQSWSSLSSLRKVFPPEELYWESDLINHRQHHPGGQPELLAQVGRHMVLPSDLNSPRGFEFFLYQIHVHQSMAVKTETESYRRAMSSLDDQSRGMTMGALYWQTNEIWQGASWASLEYGGKWKMLHYYAKKFFAPVLISPYLREDGWIDIFLISDLLEDVTNLRIEVTVYDLTTQAPAVFYSEDDVTVHAQEARNGVIEIDANAFLQEDDEGRQIVRYICYVELLDANGAPVTDPSFLLLGNYLRDVPKATVQVTSVSGEGPDFDIELETDAPALFVLIDQGEIAGYFSDNGFMMLPNLTPSTVVRFHSKDPAVQTAEDLLDALEAQGSLISLGDHPDAVSGDAHYRIIRK